MVFIFTRISILNPYKLMNSVIPSPNLIEFSTYSKNGPGFGFSHFLAPISNPLLSESKFGNFIVVVVVLYFTGYSLQRLSAMSF